MLEVNIKFFSVLNSPGVSGADNKR